MMINTKASRSLLMIVIFDCTAVVMVHGTRETPTNCKLCSTIRYSLHFLYFIDTTIPKLHFPHLNLLRIIWFHTCICTDGLLEFMRILYYPYVKPY